MESNPAKDIMDVLILFSETDQNDRLYVYGGGFQTRIVVDLLKSFDIKFTGILVSDIRGFRKEAISNEISVFSLDELGRPLDNDKVLIAVHQKWNNEIIKKLRDIGFKKIYISNNWEKSNSVLRRKYLENYCRQKDAEIKNGKISYAKGGMNFQILDIDDTSYQSMLIGDWNDTIASSIWHDFRSLTEGPYEYDRVQLRKGDVVIDLGANIGMFSCVASAKGCKVYAFEPTDKVFRQLQMNAAINSGIDVYKIAICNSNEKQSFYINSMNSDDTDTGQNTLFLDKAKLWKHNFTEVKVDGMTLDTFAGKYDLSRVDFIKADIEGAERYMLMGAKRVLKEFAPKLSLCTYHLPDDPVVMEKLIREANPNYKIIHKWMKLYAYV